jgi:beta-lactamase regulating signal transducer with metallopeptidase domain
MQSFLIYILQATGCISIAWLFYNAMMEKKTRAKTIRLYFLIAIVISMLAPLSPWAIRTSFFASTTSEVADNVTGQANVGEVKGMINSHQAVVDRVDTTGDERWDVMTLLFGVYLAVTAFFILRMGRELYAIIRCYRKGIKEKWNNLQIIWNDEYKASFSFFGLIFLNKKYLTAEELDKVLAHERIHATQYHSTDLLVVQLVSAFMWFNPFIYTMRNAMQLVHEYLADEGVLAIGIDKVQYQQSLLDHITESRFLSITSSYKHSLIKKRFLMMSAKKVAPVSKYRILVLMPVTALMLLGVACVNGQTVADAPKVVTAVALTKANVVYIGIENPVNISVSGFAANAIEVAIDNGTIAGESGEYVIKPVRPGKTLITVKAGGKTVRETEFRAKFLPPPVVALTPTPGSSNLVKGGRILKEELIKAGGVIVTVENADIDIQFKVLSFSLNVITNNNEQGTSAVSISDKFSANQVKLIQSLKKDQRIIIDDITAAGPDGKPRKLPMSIVFTMD